MILPTFANLWSHFANLKESDDIYVKALAESSFEALNVKVNVLNKKLVFIAAYLEPEIRCQLKALYQSVPKYSYEKVRH